MSPARRRVAESLKQHGASTPSDLAARLELTAVAVRQHLAGLEESGLVAASPRPAEGRGRPSQVWRLTPAAMRLFPDRHGELTVGLIEAMRQAIGADAFESVIDARGEAQKKKYASMLPGADAPLAERVEALAAQRTAEGYMAESRADDDGSFLLIENHCPICDAASACLSLCRIELEVFQHAIGDDAVVERTKHLLSGDERCVYRVTRRR